MSKNNQTILIAKNLSDVFYHVKSTDTLQIFGGGTDTEQLQEKALTIRAIPELKGFDRHEHFIDFGPAITLSEMIAIGRTNQPAILYDALESIATPTIRNIATLGGNICAEGIKHTLWAPLLALDTRLEFRTQNEVKYIQMREFTEIPHGFVLTKVRVPTEVWEVAIFKRIGPSHLIANDSASFVFLADTDQSILANIRIVLTGNTVFRSLELENRIIGARLPLSQKTRETFIEQASLQFDQLVPERETKTIMKIQFLNLVRYSVGQLS
jgi:CO/xanthine dehydrogenase FAD-binding subunit